jgi:PTH1 family peptidyl-tRNA hydrolase
MRSVVGSLGCEDFPRIRIGISEGQRESGDALADYVLGGFRKEQVKAVESAIIRAADAVEIILRDGTEAAMNRYNARSGADGGDGNGRGGENTGPGNGGADE